MMLADHGGRTTFRAGVVLDWGKYVGAIVVAGSFGFFPGSFRAGYLNFRLHRMGDNLEMGGLARAKEPSRV